jgi:hypothetical protein
MPKAAINDVASFFKDDKAGNHAAAATVLSTLCADAANAPNILQCGGAQGLLQASNSTDDPVAKVRAQAALGQLAPALFGDKVDLMVDSPLLAVRAFWCPEACEFLSPRMKQKYPELYAMPNNFFFELFHLCAWLTLKRHDAGDISKSSGSAGGVAGGAAYKMAMKVAIESIREVIETFENEPAAARFFSSIFCDVSLRSKSSIEAFEGFVIMDLTDIGHLGVEVLNRVDGMRLATNALTSLYRRYLSVESPLQWKDLFKDATKTAYCLKYMFRESLPRTKQKFTEHLDKNLEGKPKQLFTELVEGAFGLYKGLVDQETLATTDFLTNAQALVDVVIDGTKHADERVKLLGEIAARYMKTYIEHDPPKLPLTPHHTQVVAMLIFSQFFEQRERCLREFDQRSVILQMATGEGKSIVIAMMAIYTVVRLKKRVHVLENNDGLLQRDFKTYEPFYKQFGLTCAKSIDATSDICYCLKKHNNTFFNEQMVNGGLDLSETVLIVDEVDDLVVNEKPSLLYNKADVELSPQYHACYAALSKGETKPITAEKMIWEDCKRIKQTADAKKDGTDYVLEKLEDGNKCWLMLEKLEDGTGRLPKVPLTDDWLVYKNFADFGIEPTKDTFRNCLCTPFMYNKYCCIFGLTGSVGGEAERAYIRRTYNAVPYEVPQFLYTCDNTDKEPAKNLGVEIVPNSLEMVQRVALIAKQYYQKVPVLIITRGSENDELRKIYAALNKLIPDDPNEVMPKPSKWGPRAKRIPGIQRLQERNDQGELIIDECETTVERATKRCYTDSRQPYFRVTVTDWFGGRGHDFDCMDERANAAGGMLVIATSIPDAREWIQWKGRTARQDRPGQYLVVLSEKEEPFRSVPGLGEQLKPLSPDGKIEALLTRKDEAIRESLASFEAQQARGAWLNEVCQKYYREKPREPSASWPSKEQRLSDTRLREMLKVPFASGEKIREAAKDRLGLTLEGPPAEWGWAAEDQFGIEAKRKSMAVIFLIDRTYLKFLQKVVDATLRVYDRYLEEDDLVGYYGLGDEWIFEMDRKGDRPEELREKIAGSVEKRGDPNVYSSIDKMVDVLVGVDEAQYSKWLVVLTDTADFECSNAKNIFDKEAPARAEAAADELIGKMHSTKGLNLVIIDAHELGNFNKKHHMWPTWQRLSQRMTNEVGDGNTGLNIEAAEESQIDEAFDKVAGAMTGGAAG